MADTFNSNIYEMSDILHIVSKNFFSDEDVETMSLGSYGFLNSMFSKILSDNIRIGQENANEMFYNRARLPKNVMAYAIEADIEDINAVPSSIPVILYIAEEDINRLIDEHGGKYAVIDSNCKFYIDEMEFHLDYPLEIYKKIIRNKSIIYTAKYDISIKNPISDVDSPYIKAPYKIIYNGTPYVAFYVTLRQVIKKIVKHKIISNSPIANKSYEFDFEEQLAAFDVFAQEGNTTIHLTPVFSGVGLNTERYYCNYSYIDDNNMRVIFDNDSYIPPINTEITTIIYSTLGSKSNFELVNRQDQVIEDTEDYAYLGSRVMIHAQNKAEGGKDTRSINELKRILPKVNLTRGNLISNADLNAYFNLINSETNHIQFFPYIHNQTMRTYYGYYLSKNNAGDVVPTNTVDLSFSIKELNNDNKYVKVNHVVENGVIAATRYTFEPGAYIGYEWQIAIDKDTHKPIMDDNGHYQLALVNEFLYNPQLLLSRRTDLILNCLMKYYGMTYEEANKTTEIKLQLSQMTIGDYYHTYGFLYTFPYRVILAGDGPYVSYYINTMDEYYPISYERGNSESPVEFILTTSKWDRPYTGEKAKTYTLTFMIIQNIQEDYNFIMPIERALTATPSYSLLEQFKLKESINGILTGNTIDYTTSKKYADITDLVLNSIMSESEIAVVTDNMNEGNCIYNSMDNLKLKYYVVTNTLNNTTTDVYEEDYNTAIDRFNASKTDQDNIYIKMIDSKGKLYQLYDFNTDNNAEVEFTSNKQYIESHTNIITGDTETKVYSSLIDALHESVKAYYTVQPVKEYTISEAVVGKEGYENILYDSSKDSDMDSLFFLQLKNREGIINMRTTYATVADKIDKIPEGEGYQYMIISRYGIVDNENNTYTSNWEPYDEAAQADFLSVIDNYNDIEGDTYLVYDEDDLIDNCIIQKLKILTVDPYTGLVDSAIYMDTLMASIRYMVRSQKPCLLYYANRHDVSNKVFTQNEEDLIFKYTYVKGEEPLTRLVITNDVVYNTANEPRYKIIVKTYVEEDMLPDTLLDIDGIESHEFFKANMYVLAENEVLIEHIDVVGDNSYTDDRLLNNDIRNYRIDYTKGGISETTRSFLELKKILELYATGVFKYNELFRYEKLVDGGNGLCLFNGLGFKERYYLEFLNNEGESNCYTITSRSRLAYVYTKVFNTIKRNIERGVLTLSKDPYAYINVYDQFANKIDPNKHFEGTAYSSSDVQKFYIIWNYVGIYVNEDIKIFTNVIDALNYGASTGKSFDILDSEENILYTIDVNTTPTLYIRLLSTQVMNSYFIYTDITEFNSTVKTYDADSYYEITQSYRLAWNGTEFDVAPMYMKDLSIGKRNCWVDTQYISEMADLGLDKPSLPTTDDNTSSGDKVDIVTDDGTVIKSLDDLIKAMMKNPKLKVVAILDGGSSDLGDLNEDPIIDDSGNKIDTSVTLYTKDTFTVVDGKNLISRVAAIVVIYDPKNNPICYYKAQLCKVLTEGNYEYTFRIEIQTDDVLDKNNKILINKGIVGTCSACYYPRKNTVAGRYVQANNTAKIFTMCKFAEKDGSNLQFYGDLGLITIADLPGLGLNDYTVTNIYDIDNGLDMFEDFTEIVHTTASVNTTSNGDQYFKLASTPVIGHRYTTDNDKVIEYIKSLKYMKNHIDKSLNILENQYSIDFKLYNTYGPGNVYYTTDVYEEEKDFLNKVNISLHFATKLSKAADDYTIRYIKEDIKEAIDSFDKLSDYHLQNLIATIYKKYENSIEYLEFRGFNNYPADRKHLLIDPDMEKECIPEFVNINVYIDEEGEYTSDIEIASI